MIAGIVIAILVVVIVCVIGYVYYERRQREKEKQTDDAEMGDLKHGYVIEKNMKSPMCLFRSLHTFYHPVECRII